MQRAVRVAAIALFAAVSLFAAASRDFWHELELGNQQFIGGKLAYNDLINERNSHRTGQHPPWTILSCADSRVPPELMFDKTIGDLFVVRVAGNVTDDFPLASIEYAVAQPRAYTKLIVVMGHEDCGAVKAAIGTKGYGGSDPLTKLVARIKENIGAEQDLKKATELNAQKSAKFLTDHSKIIRDAVCAGQLQIKPAYYSFDGKVTALRPLPGTPSYPCH